MFSGSVTSHCKSSNSAVTNLHFDSCSHEVSDCVGCVVSGRVKHGENANKAERFIVELHCHSECLVPSLRTSNQHSEHHDRDDTVIHHVMRCCDS
jgi:hypothetical protein